MGTTLDNGTYLPDEGERNCYEGLAGNWVALDNHLGSTNIHVTINDKQAWDGHVADSVKHVTAEDKNKWDAVTSKANDSDVVHKSGNETIGGQKIFSNNRIIVGRNTDTNSAIQLVNSDVVGGSASGASGLEVYGSSVSTDNKIGGVTVGEWSNNGGSYASIECNRTVSDVKTSNTIRNLIRNDGSKEFSAGVDNDCKLGHPYFRWSGVYATNYYYGSNNVEFSTKFVTTDTAQTISGNKTFSSINGVEPSSLSLPRGNLNDIIDISSYITALDGTSNSYTVPANGWISIAVVGIAIAIVSSSWSDSRLRESSGNVRMLYPVLKNETLDISVMGTTLSYARFIPCQGNV